MGLVQKNGSIYQKTSVDRIVGIKDANGDQKLHLLEFKARVKQDRVQKEEDRIDMLRCKNLMVQNGIFAEMDADNQHSHLGIHDPSERLQVLHHASVYSQDCCFHAVGDTKNLLSVVKMNFSPELLRAYDAMLKKVYDSGLEIFYRDDRNGSGQIAANDTEMKRIEAAVAKYGRTFGAGEGMSRFDFNYRLWRKATEEENLPLPPVKQILPLSLAHWNINKPPGDITTQMLWEQNYHPPENNVQTALVKRLGHQYPSYVCHRLSQLFATKKQLDSFPSILSFRDCVRKDLPFWKSFCHMESTLCSMAAEYDPERPLALPAAVANRQGALPSNLPFWPGVFPTTGSSPKRARRSYYGDANNSHKYHYQRHNHCLGIVHIVCDPGSGNPVKHKTCAQCGRKDAAWYCGVCHLYFHNMTPREKVRGGEAIPMMAAPTGRMNEDGTPDVGGVVDEDAIELAPHGNAVEEGDRNIADEDDSDADTATSTEDQSSFSNDTTVEEANNGDSGASFEVGEVNEQVSNVLSQIISTVERKERKERSYLRRTEDDDTVDPRFEFGATAMDATAMDDEDDQDSVNFDAASYASESNDTEAGEEEEDEVSEEEEVEVVQPTPRKRPRMLAEIQSTLDGRYWREATTRRVIDRD